MTNINKHMSLSLSQSHRQLNSIVPDYEFSISFLITFIECFAPSIDIFLKQTPVGLLKVSALADNSAYCDNVTRKRPIVDCFRCIEQYRVQTSSIQSRGVVVSASCRHRFILRCNLRTFQVTTTSIRPSVCLFVRPLGVGKLAATNKNLAFYTNSEFISIINCLPRVSLVRRCCRRQVTAISNQAKTLKIT